MIREYLNQIVCVRVPAGMPYVCRVVYMVLLFYQVALLKGPWLTLIIIQRLIWAKRLLFF